MNNLKSTLIPTSYDVAAIAKGEVIPDTSALSPLENIKLGLSVKDFREKNDLVEKDSIVDYDAVGKFVRDSNGK